MVKLLTFIHTNPGHRRVPRWPAVLAAMLIAVAAPALACEKSTPHAWIAGAQGQRQTEATFTGEFVNGAPVYRLSAITVVSRRPAEVARTPHDADQRRAAGQSGRHAPAAQTPKGKVASASDEAIGVKPCIG